MKTSPQTKQVSDFIEGVNHPLKKGIEILCKIVLSANKDITEHIKWNAPSFSYNGDDRITMSSPYSPSNAKSISLIFHRGAKKRSNTGFEFKEDEGLFVWKTSDRAIVTFHTVKEIEDKKAILKRVVSKWVLATE